MVLNIVGGGGGGARLRMLGGGQWGPNFSLAVNRVEPLPPNQCQKLHFSHCKLII